jgi:uncharacterized RDD family membrane protein YckC/predicted nucleic acid-binding Zn ribbon protein
VNCQNELKPGDKFCSGCGKEARNPENICFNCDEVLNPGDKFCSKCGTVKQEPCAGCGAGIPANEDTCPECGLSKSGHKQAKIENSNEDNAKARQLMGLIGKQISLSELKRDFPWLMNRMNNSEQDRLLQALHPMMKGKTDIELIITSTVSGGARVAFLKKPGVFSRILTVLVDVPIFLAFFLGVLALLIGSAKQGQGIIPVTGELRGLVAGIWFFMSYFLYFVQMEKMPGATIGGLIFGMRVVDHWGNSLPYSSLIWRNFCKLIPVLGPVWINGSCSMMSNPVVKS